MTTSVPCPYCPPKMAQNETMGAPEAMKAWHDAGHPHTPTSVPRDEQELREKLHTIIVTIRAGRDPDTNQLHLTDDEATDKLEQLINQYATSKENEVFEFALKNDGVVKASYRGHKLTIKVEPAITGDTDE